MEGTPDGDERVIRMRVLGISEIQCGRKVISPVAEVVFALGLYLCARAGERIAREEVSEIFWGEGRESQGRHSLRQMLYRLRQKGLKLDEEGEELYLDPSRVESDLGRALGEGWPSAATAAEIEAAALFAPGFTRHISERFNEWMDGLRDRLSAQHRRAALRQISLARREGRWTDLDRWALQVLRSDPLNEEATLARAESAAISGSKAVALEIIDAYMEELGDRAPVIGLPASMLRRRIAERTTDWSGRGRRDVPLVGRQELMARLTGYVDAAGRGEGSSVVLWGAPGIGKTRLAKEACSYAEIAGFRTVVTGATKVGGDRPLALLFTVLPLLRQLPGALGCDPLTLSTLNVMSADLSESRLAADMPFDRSLFDRLVASVRDLLDAVTGECRLLLLTDDLHNADSRSLDVLHSVIPERHSKRLLWLSTSRHRPTQPPSGTTEVMISLYVPPLDAAASRLMAESLCEGMSGPALDQIISAAGGNPLFAVELSSHRQVAGASSTTIPSSLTSLIESRLTSLDALLLRLLRLTTLLGNQATVLRLKQLVGKDIDLAEQLETLETQGILHLNASKTVELHECWHQTISAGLSSATRAALSLECASLLETEAPLALESIWRAASLFAEIGEYSKAVRLFLECGEELLIRGLPAEASRLAEQALSMAHNPKDRLRLTSLQARGENALGQIELVAATCERGIALYQNTDALDLQEYTVLVALLSDALAKTHRDNSGTVRELARLAQNSAVPPVARQFACLQGIAGVYANIVSPLEDLFLEGARQSMVQHGETTMGLLVEIIHAAEHGDAGRVNDLEQRCSRREHEPMPMGLRARALFTRAAAQRLIGEWATSSRIANSAFALAMEHHLVMDAIRVANLMMFMHLDQDALDAAAEWIARREQLATGARYSQANQDLVHARARLYAQGGSYDLAIREYRHRIAEAPRDPMMLRRGVDFATLSFSYAGCGQVAESRRFLTLTTPILNETRAGLQGDFIAEMLLRALELLNDPDEFQSLGTAYSTRRYLEYAGALPRGHRALATFIQRAQN